MDFTFLVLAFCFVIFLYIVYVLSRDDFVILRSNTSVEKIFNVAYLSVFFSLLSARLFYVLSNPKPIFATPLGFLLFPYFPGLSLISGLLGGYLISIIILKFWKLPIGRITDFFSMGFLTAFPVGFLFSFFSSINQKLSLPFYFSIILYLLLLFVFVKFVLSMSTGGKIKDGSLSFLFMLSFSLFYLLSNISFSLGKNILNFENIFSFLIFLIFSIIFLQKEKLIEKGILKKNEYLDR